MGLLQTHLVQLLAAYRQQWRRRSDNRSDWGRLFDVYKCPNSVISFMHERNHSGFSPNFVQTSALASAAVGQTQHRPSQLYILTAVSGPIRVFLNQQRINYNPATIAPERKECQTASTCQVEDRTYIHRMQQVQQCLWRLLFLKRYEKYLSFTRLNWIWKIITKRT